MEQNSKKCIRCGTDNAPEYAYCKNCGAPLNATGGAQYSNPQGAPFTGFNVPPVYVDYSAVEPQLMGVETEKVQAYVGDKKRDSFMRSFVAIARTGRKTFFNWVVAALGLLVGYAYSACWFFYRKMYRVGFAICAALLLLTVAVTAVNYNEVKADAEKMYAQTSNMTDDELIDYIDSSDVVKQSARRTYTKYGQSLVCTVGVFLLAMFANYIYLKSATNTIKRNDATRGIGDCFTYTALGTPNLAPAIVIPIITTVVQSLITLAPYYGLLAKCSPQQLLVLLMSCGL